MKRCGFNSYVLQPQVDARAALASLDDFTEYYQTSVDQPTPRLIPIGNDFSQ
jgi:uncharacterized protein (DUF934 family)